MDIEKKILKIYEEIKRNKKSLSDLHEVALISPVENTSVNSGFGARWGGSHNGVDLKADKAEVKSPADGVVVKTAVDEYPCGGTIVIDHAGGFRTGFCHLQKINVRQGQEVKQGDIIGISGGGADDPGKGRSDGRHLHFTLRKDGQLVNPMEYIDKDSVVMSGEAPKSSTMSASEKAYAAATSSTPQSTVSNSYGQLLQNLKSAGGLSEMVSTKNEFKEFLMNEAESQSDELFGGKNVTIPADDAHKGQSGWQSSNAWDIPTAIDDPVYAVVGGTVATFNDYGPTPTVKDNKTLFGVGFTVDSDNGLPDVYYTHLKNPTVKIGDKISCGQLLGYVMDFPNSSYDHLHIGVESGHVRQFINDDGSLKCSKGGVASSKNTSQSSSSSTSSTVSPTDAVTSSTSVLGATPPKRDDVVYNLAKNLGKTFLPTEGRQIQEQRSFGKDVQNRYGRVIIPKDSNPKIKSPISGVVDNSRYSSSCKNQITIKGQSNGKIYLQFCGIDTPLVRDGMKVSAGQVIGRTDSDVEASLYDSSWNRLYIKDDFRDKTPDVDNEDKKKKKDDKEKYYSDPAVALLASLPAMAAKKIFGDRYDEKTGERTQKRWGGVADKKEVDPWLLNLVKKPFARKVNEDLERIKKLLK